jgi:hypothetical protein
MIINPRLPKRGKEKRNVAGFGKIERFAKKFASHATRKMD